MAALTSDTTQYRADTTALTADATQTAPEVSGSGAPRAGVAMGAAGVKGAAGAAGVVACGCVVAAAGVSGAPPPVLEPVASAGGLPRRKVPEPPIVRGRAALVAGAVLGASGVAQRARRVRDEEWLIRLTMEPA